MKLVAIIIAVMILLSVVSGFDLSVYVVEDLSSYPELSFEENVLDLSSASSEAISSTVSMLSSVSQVLMSTIRGIADPVERPELSSHIMLQAIRDADVSSYDGPYLIQLTITSIKMETHIVLTGFFLKAAFWDLVDQGIIDDIWS